ncbi:MAG: 50S ribosomal protein L4 [Planctomycetales bacterium]|nr:50S ribosomal protein L4 [Planctomycetales bacterium]
MVRVPLYESDGRFAELLSVDESVFGDRIRRVIVKAALVRHEANQRRGTACTRERGEVAGSGRKPWAQKHTGRARAGSFQSPIWKGGGTVFGPRPRDYSLEMPTKARRLALKSALLGKFRDGEVAAIRAWAIGDPPKTKTVAGVLRRIVGERTVLLGTSENDASLLRAARNIPTVRVRPVAEWNTWEVLRQARLLVTLPALERLTGKAPAPAPAKAARP